MGTRWPNAIEEAGDFGLRSHDIGQKGEMGLFSAFLDGPWVTGYNLVLASRHPAQPVRLRPGLRGLFLRLGSNRDVFDTF